MLQAPPSACPLRRPACVGNFACIRSSCSLCLSVAWDCLRIRFLRDFILFLQIGHLPQPRGASPLRRHQTLVNLSQKLLRKPQTL